MPPFADLDGWGGGPATGEGSTGIGGDIGAPSPGGPGMVGIGGNQVDPNDVAGMLAGLESNQQDMGMSGRLSGVFGLGGLLAGLPTAPFSLSNLAMQVAGRLANANLQNQINTEMARAIGDLDDPGLQSDLDAIDEGIGMTSGQPGIDAPQSDVDMGMVDAGIGMTSEGGGPTGSGVGGSSGTPGEGGAGVGGSSGGDATGEYHKGGIVRMPHMMSRLVPGADEDMNGRRNVLAMLEEGERVTPAKKKAGGMAIRPGGRMRAR